MSTASEQPDRAGTPEVRVIPVGPFRNRAGEFEHRLPPVSRAHKAEVLLGELDEARISPAMRERLSQMAVDPAELEASRPERHRIETGWLHILRFRAYTLLLSMAVENDRLLAEAQYAADPQADLRVALSMPEPHKYYAALVHDDAFEDLMDSVDRAARKVRGQNSQEVGERLVELPLTVVPALFRDAAGRESEDVTTVDGNSRLISCLDRIQLEEGWLDGTKSTTPVTALPSQLMRLDLKRRRELIRKSIKKSYGTLRDPEESQTERNRAAVSLNAMTVPVQIIVGYEDDRPEYGTRRFPAAVRSLLVRMNVGVTPFESGAQHAVVAEEIVRALYDEGLFGGEPSCDAEDFRDALIGRGQVRRAMKNLGFDPGFPDQRFALVVEQLTRKERTFNRVFRDKLQKEGRLGIKDRNDAVAELGLRSYSASRTEKQLQSIRRALDTGCLWQELVDKAWFADPVYTDSAIDNVCRKAGQGSDQDRLYLGVIGMIALVTSGHLLAARGSAEQLVGGAVIARSSVGQVIKSLLDKPGGRKLLADAVKRTRKGLDPRWWDAREKRLVEQPADWRGANFDAHLRLAAHAGFGGSDAGNPAAREEALLTRFQATLTTVGEQLDDLISEREKNGTKDRLSWVEVEASMELLDGIKEDLQGISESRRKKRR
ncbi:hypothetical protein ACFQVC_38105 [Streptomyces monticola]|uniref:Uncharacterized protein n=1 Tax=Streptomyces monticola TaxID=2666263 RepID=A0ABW2JWX8_9ACTN